MRKIMEYWAKGWLVLFLFFCFLVVLGIVMLPLNLLHKFLLSKLERGWEIGISVGFGLLYIPLAYYKAASITGLLKMVDRDDRFGRSKDADPDPRIATNGGM